MRPLSPAAEALVLRFEGLNQPGRVPDTRCPSGVTLGYGYDLAHHTAAELEADWGPFLTGEQIHRLKAVVGYAGAEARLLSRNVADILISTTAARQVFDRCSVPKYQGFEAEAFPGTEAWPVDVEGALFSLIYNRGPDLTGDRRREMRAIAATLAWGPWTVAGVMNVAAELRSMKRLWPDVPGLLARREAEAQLVLSCLPTTVEAA